MRKVFSRKITVFIAVAFLFIVGQIMGSAAIRHLFFQYKMSELGPMAKQMSSEYAKNSTFDKLSHNVIVRVLDAHGKELLKKDNNKKLHGVDMKHEIRAKYKINIKNIANKFLPQIIAGKTIYSLEEVQDLPQTSIVVGVPVKKGKLITGALFVFVPADDINAALNGFTLVFTVTLILGTAIIGVLLKFYINESRQLDSMQKEYVANISHELKSPVSSIKALTETLADNIVSDEVTRQKYYNIILKESARLQNLISDILELSRLQSSKIVIKKQQINTKELLKEIRNRYSVVADDLGINFKITDAAMNAPDIFSSKDRVLQILCILIDNAIKFVDENGEIAIDVKVNHFNVIFEVIDNGIGIRPDVLPFIFDRFYKEDTSRNTCGSGLGLSIAKEILTVLHEDISVKSEYGQGTAFTFTVKRA